MTQQRFDPTTAGGCVGACDSTVPATRKPSSIGVAKHLASEATTVRPKSA